MMAIIGRAKRAHAIGWLMALLAFARMPTNDGASAGTDTPENTGGAFEAFFGRFEGKVFGYLWRMVGDEQSARDLTQETFLRAWQHFQELAPDRKPVAWLFRVAANLALSHLRRRGIVQLAPLDDAMPGASDHGRRIAERDAVEHALLTLTPRQRSVLVLHEVYDLTCDEIGHILDISRDAAKMALWRAREAFRASYLHEEDAR
jgi:RNA polymerase sigma-70 factor (ECF subfamily)